MWWKKKPKVRTPAPWESEESLEARTQGLREELRARVTPEQWAQWQRENEEYFAREDAQRPADWIEPSITLAEADAEAEGDVTHQSLAAEMRRRGVERMTRTEYLSWQCAFDGVPEDWDWELEAQLPWKLQDTFMTIDPSLPRGKSEE